MPLPWTPALLEVKRAVEPPSGVAFNSVLLNRYRTGKDSVSWHADDEPEFGERPVIASVSFGGTRTFQLKHKKRKELKASVELTHGSLLIMRGGTQANWLHQDPEDGEAGRGAAEPHVPGDRRPGRVGPPSPHPGPCPGRSYSARQRPLSGAIPRAGEASTMMDEKTRDRRLRRDRRPAN